MRKTFWQALAIFLLGVCALVLSIRAGDAEFVEGTRLPSKHLLSQQPRVIAQLIEKPPAQTPAQNANDPHGVLSQACGLRPDPKPRRPTRQELGSVKVQLGLDRFRRPSSSPDPNTPKEMIALAHPTNFGLRFQQDASGQVTNQAPIVVLHETVSSASSTINFFQTPHADDDDQVSYHSLIDLDGTVIYMVPPDKRAFGAANSQFNGLGVKTNPKLPASVNNFAYHISLVTPRDGRNNKPSHSGYTQAQYESLAWLIAKTSIPPSNLTAHKLVDRTGSRSDPRSFDGPTFLEMLKQYPQSQEISIACTG
jgi:N-acetyl-anhydromuramyl-L-alanine amidase AmpD